MTPSVRWLLAALLGVALTLLLNHLGVWWLGATVFTSHSFYDGCAAFLTLVIPSLLGGVVMGLTAREHGLNVAAVTFLLFCAAGFAHPFWRIPPVMAESAHSRGLFFFLHSPLVALAFGSLGAWAASKIATGMWKFEDAEPVRPPG